jgi:Asp-tRNA(Asn)/Glu-tRNA(Gln) amidotransferase A subunit family amidase
LFNSVWTLLHLPCITLPAGRGPQQLPLGVQLVGPRRQDERLLTWAAWSQSTLQGA